MKGQTGEHPLEEKERVTCPKCGAFTDVSSPADLAQWFAKEIASHQDALLHGNRLLLIELRAGADNRVLDASDDLVDTYKVKLRERLSFARTRLAEELEKAARPRCAECGQ